MADMTTPLSAAIDAVRGARGEEMDSLWAYGLSWALLMKDVEPDVVAAELQEVFGLVRETRESPEELYGSTSARADELCRQWLDEGRRVLSRQPSISWRQVPASALATTGRFSIIMTGLLLLTGQTTTTWTAGMLVIPVAIGVSTPAGMAIWETLLRRRNEATAVVVSTLFVGTVASVAGTLAIQTADQPLGTSSTWWSLVPAMACLLLARLLSRHVGDVPAHGSPPAANDGEWVARAAAVLRGGVRLSDRRVNTLVAEARAHAAESGNTLAEEFGTPEDYAARFAPDLARQHLLRAALAAACAALAALQLVDGWSWNAASLLTIFVCLSIREVRQARALR